MIDRAKRRRHAFSISSYAKYMLVCTHSYNQTQTPTQHSSFDCRRNMTTRRQLHTSSSAPRHFPASRLPITLLGIDFSCQGEDRCPTVHALSTLGSQGVAWTTNMRADVHVDSLLGDCQDDYQTYPQQAVRDA